MKHERTKRNVLKKKRVKKTTVGQSDKNAEIDAKKNVASKKNHFFWSTRMLFFQFSKKNAFHENREQTHEKEKQS